VISDQDSATAIVDYHSLATMKEIPQFGYSSGTAALPGAVLSVNTGLYALQVFDLATESIVGQIPIGGYSGGTPVVNAAGTTIYVPGDRVVKIDAAKRAPSGFIGGLTDDPEAAVLSPDGGTLYTMHNDGPGGEDSDFVYVIDTQTGTVTHVLTGYGTDSITLSKDGGTVFMSVSSSEGHRPSDPSCPPTEGTCVFDAATFSLLAQIGTRGGNLATSQDGSYVYATQAETLEVVDTTTLQVASTVNMPDNFIVEDILTRPVGNSALLIGSASDASTAYVFDTSTNQVAHKFPVPCPEFNSYAFAPDGASVWFVSVGTGPTLTGESFSDGSVIGQIAVGGIWLAFQP
jgi:hypothetical protein